MAEQFDRNFVECPCCGQRVKLLEYGTMVGHAKNPIESLKSCPASWNRPEAWVAIQKEIAKK